MSNPKTIIDLSGNTKPKTNVIPSSSPTDDGFSFPTKKVASSSSYTDEGQTPFGTSANLPPSQDNWHNEANSSYSRQNLGQKNHSYRQQPNSSYLDSELGLSEDQDPNYYSDLDADNFGGGTGGYNKYDEYSDEYDDTGGFGPNKPNNWTSRSLQPLDNLEDFDPQNEPSAIEQLEAKKTGSFLKDLPVNAKIFWTKHNKTIRNLVLVSGFLGLIGFAIMSFWLIGIYASISDIEAKATSISEGSIVFDRNNKEMFRFVGDVKREVVTIDQIPETMQSAVIALEDENFYTNSVGIPWKNLIGASLQCLFSRGNNCRGGSGLSQQLIKNVTQDDDANLDRKVRELLTAIKFNQEIGQTEQEKQDKVLELYLNWVPFGRNNYGVKTSAQSYFGHDITSPELTIPKACYLAAMPQRPTPFAEAVRIEMRNREKQQAQEDLLPNPAWEILESRKNACIQKLYDKKIAKRGTQKLIATQEEVDILKKEKVNFVLPTPQEVAYGHIREYLTNEIINKFNDGEFSITASDLETKGYRIHTTFDVEMQNKVQQVLNESTASLIQANGGNNAASMVLDGPSGEILAMIGSLDFNNEAIAGQVNVATSPRQPGSSYKPYVYAAAFESGFNPGTVLLDVPTDFGGYAPKNFSGTFSGATTVRRSLQDSLNIPAIKGAYLNQADGAFPNTAEATQNFIKFAERAGVKHPFRDTCTLSAALGGCEVTMISHVTGMNTLLHDGTLTTARPIKKIDLKDSTLYSEEAIKLKYPVQAAAITPEVAKQVTDVMSDYESRTPSVWGQARFNLQLEGWEGVNSVAAKTGTTNDVKDSWVVGGSPYYTVSLWVGNTDGAPMNSDASASNVSGPIWNDIMTQIHAEKAPIGFNKDGLQEVSIDPTTGLLGQGRVELMTTTQKAILDQAQKNLSNPSYSPSQNSILQNRTPVVSRNLRVNKLDGKLVLAAAEQPAASQASAPAGPFVLPEQLIEEVNCKVVISEFPQSPNWANPANNYRAGGDSACPTEPTDMNNADSIKPKIETNLTNPDRIPDEIEITVTSPIPADKIEGGNPITKIVFSVGGEPVTQVENQGSLIIDVQKEKLTGIKDVLISATDSLGITSELIIEKVDFDSSEVKRSSSSSSRTNSSSNGNQSSSAASSKVSSVSTASSAASSLEP